MYDGEQLRILLGLAKPKGVRRKNVGELAAGLSARAPARKVRVVEVERKPAPVVPAVIRARLTADRNLGQVDHVIDAKPAIIPVRARSKAKPRHAERVEIEQSLQGNSYEERNWPKLSPHFRAAHNRLRQMRGMSPIPPPKIDLYVAPPKQKPKPVDLSAPEVKQAVAEYLRPVAMLPPSDEGFTINGEPDPTEPRPQRRGRAVPDQPGEGFTINGKPI